MAVSLPIFVRPLPYAAITTGNERSNRLASHLFVHEQIGIVWQTNGNANIWVRVDLGAVKDVDFIALLAANATSASKIRVRMGATQAEVDGAAPYDSGVLDFISPVITNDTGLYHSYLRLGTIQQRRWVRIDISGHTGDFIASNLVIGAAFSSDKFYAPGTESGVKDTGDMEISSSGAVAILEGVKLRTIKVNYAWTGEAIYEGRFRALFEQHGRTKPFYMCFDPTANAYRNAKTYFGWFQSEGYASGHKLAGKTEMATDMVSVI